MTVDTYLREAPDWNSLVSLVAVGDTAASESLYRSFSSYRYFFTRLVGWADAEDLYQDLIVDLLDQIRNKELREPSRLAGYVRAIAMHKVVAFRRSGAKVHTQGTLCETHIPYDGPDPERETYERERNKIASRVLNALPERDREVLTRYYLHEEKPEKIQAEMALTPTQFRLIKSRAKARYTCLYQRRIGDSHKSDERMRGLQPTLPQL